MKTRKLCLGILLAASLVTSSTFAQEIVMASSKTEETTTNDPASIEKKDEEPAFTLSGSVDTYFRSSLGTQNAFMESSSGGFSYGPSSSFSDLKGFGLGMANLIASYAGDKVGFTADLVFGPRGQSAVFGTASGQAVINQMFAYYKVTDKVTLNLGQFNTFLGYEVISPAVNFHYSTSYLFSYGPFNHTGLRADFDLGNGLVAKLAVMNPTDMVEFNSVNTYTVGGQLGKTSDAGGIWINFLYGDQDGRLQKEKFAGALEYSAGNTLQVDITTGFNLSEKFYLGFNSSLQRTASGETFTEAGNVRDVDADATSFLGFAVYPKLTLTEEFAVGLRAEYFGLRKDHLEIFATDEGGDGAVTALTLSANYKVGALTIIPELRVDKTTEDSFLTEKGKPTDSMTSLALAAVYKF